LGPGFFRVICVHHHPATSHWRKIFSLEFLGIFTEAAALAAAFSFSDLASEMSLESEKT